MSKSLLLISCAIAALAFEVTTPSVAVAQSEPPICTQARDARARDSRAAPNLERQCEAAVQAMKPPPKALGRVQRPAPLHLGRAQQPTASAPTSPGSKALGRTPRPAPASSGDAQMPGAGVEATASTDAASERDGRGQAFIPPQSNPGIIPRFRLTNQRLSEGDRHAILAMHNSLRAKSNLPPLVWDPRLAAEAAASAEHMARIGHVIDRAAPENESQNAAMFIPSGHYSARQMVTTWSGKPGQPQSDPANLPPDSISGQATHLTQIVSPASTAIGCALRGSAAADFLVCRYALENDAGRVP
jgi:uncharacterized protein YkwD